MPSFVATASRSSSSIAWRITTSRWRPGSSCESANITGTDTSPGSGGSGTLIGGSVFSGHFYSSTWTVDSTAQLAPLAPCSEGAAVGTGTAVETFTAP
jgi:hypothetical protein